MAREQVKEREVLDPEDHEDDDDQHTGAEDEGSDEGEGDDDEEGSTAEGGEHGPDDSVDPEIDPELEARRKRRAQEKREKRQRQREAQERNQRELAEARQTIATLQRTTEDLSAWRAQNEANAIDQRLAYLNAEYQKADTAYGAAITKGNGDDVRFFDRERQKFAAAYHEAAGVKQRVQAQRQPQQQTQQPQTYDPSQARAQALAVEWANKNPWWDSNGTDEDSAIVNAVDAALANSKIYRPDTPEYWAELQKRVERRLPDRFRRSPTRGGPPMSGTRDSASGASPRQFPRQVTDAWREAGLYDDPPKLKRVQDAYLKSLRNASR